MYGKTRVAYTKGFGSFTEPDHVQRVDEHLLTIVLAAYPVIPAL